MSHDVWKMQDRTKDVGSLCLQKKLILYDKSTKSLTTGEKGGLEAVRGDEKSFQ